MFKKIAVLMAPLCVAMTVASPARATFIGIAEDTGGTAYEWYVPSLPIYWGSQYYDGVLPDGRPFVKFEGTDASPNGHCLELAFSSMVGPYVSPGSIEVEVYENGTYTTVANPDVDSGEYPKMRVWMNHNTGPAGSSLAWALYFVAPDITRSASFSVTRLEIDKATCTPPDAPLPWVSWEGWTSSYTFTHGNF